MKDMFGEPSDLSSEARTSAASEDTFPESVVDNARALRDIALEKYIQEAIRKEKIFAVTTADDIRTQKKYVNEAKEIVPLRSKHK